MGVAAIVAASALTAVAAQRVLRRLPRGVALLGEAGALSTLLALRGLRVAVEGVRSSLEAGDLGGARARAARDLVSRDTADLDASELSGAAIQSLAENLSDSVVAPLLAYAAGGLPAAAAYRALNTADAMWGYRTPELLHRGRAAARADDVANLIPARLTALYIAARSPQPGAALRVALARPRAGARLPTAAGRWRRWRAGSASGSSSAARTRSTPRRRSRRPADIGRALGVVGG